MADLNGKVAIVTGGSRGIGRAIAAAILEAGGRVVIASRNQDSVQRTVEELGSVWGEAQVVGMPCDVGSADSCRALIDGAAHELGRLDILINNAGIGRFAPVEELSEQDWRAVLATNLDGVFFCSRAAVPHLKDVGGGWIINIGSLAGRNAFPGGAAYNASKFGLIGFSEAFMQEVRHDGIRVSLIMPGSVATEFRGRTDGDDWKMTSEDVALAVMSLFDYPGRTLPSRLEMRPSRPPRRG